MEIRNEKKEKGARSFHKAICNESVPPGCELLDGLSARGRGWTTPHSPLVLVAELSKQAVLCEPAGLSSQHMDARLMIAASFRSFKGKSLHMKEFTIMEERHHHVKVVDITKYTASNR